MICFRSTEKAHPAGRLTALLLCLALAAAFLLPAAAPAEKAEKEEKVVRVGWYESSFNRQDDSGRRSGYGYEYQIKIAAYTGWRYEYVTGSWSELMQKLADGDIDLMSDVSYLPEREEFMLYASLPMGSEDYYLFTSPNKSDISSLDYSTLNGKKIGVNKGSIQANYFREWAEKNGVGAEVVELTGSEAESLRMLRTGQLDGYVTVDYFTEGDTAVPVCKIGSSDFFFAVSKKRPDLLPELNNAMNRIQEENRYYNQEMLDRHVIRAGANAFLSVEERDWLAGHGVIRVGYQDNYLAFCAKDPETGELTGALKDYLAHATDYIANADLAFEAVAYPTAEEALEALKKGEVDCVFPSNLNAYDSEEQNLLTTQALVRTEVFAIVDRANEKFFDSANAHVIVAVNKGNPNYESFLADSFPAWRIIYYEDTPACLQAVSKGVADCVLVSNYRYNDLADLCARYELTALDTGVELDYCFAVRHGETELYSILSKVAAVVPETSVNAALHRYIARESKPSVTDFITDHPVAVMVAGGVMALAIIAMAVRIVKYRKKQGG